MVLLRIASIAVLVFTATTIASAQHKPSEAAKPFVVMSAQSLDDLQKTLQADNKTSELIDSGGMHDTIRLPLTARSRGVHVATNFKFW